MSLHSFVPVRSCAVALQLFFRLCLFWEFIGDVAALGEIAAAVKCRAAGRPALDQFAFASGLRAGYAYAVGLGMTALGKAGTAQKPSLTAPFHSQWSLTLGTLLVGQKIRLLDILHRLVEFLPERFVEFPKQ